MVDGEVGPELVTILFSPADVGNAEVLLTDGSLPLSIITAFFEEAVREQCRLAGRDSSEPKA
jgi:hypothetical protein